MFPNDAIFVIFGGHLLFVCCHGNGGLEEKFLVYFFTHHSTVWTKTIALFEFLNKSYPCGVSPHKRQCDFFIFFITNM